MPLANGDLACVWFAGTQEGLSDISVHISLLSKGSDLWTEARLLDDDPSRSEQNPILVPASDGRLWLLYTSDDRVAGGFSCRWLIATAGQSLARRRRLSG